MGNSKNHKFVKLKPFLKTKSDKTELAFKLNDNEDEW